MLLAAIHWPFSFEQPGWLWLLLAIPLIVLVSRRSLAGLDRQRRITAVTLRCLLIAVLAVVLGGVQYVRRNDHVAVMFVLDRSRSVPNELRLSAQEYIKKIAKAADRDDRLGVVGFDGEADVDLIPSRGGFEVLGFEMPQIPDRTNIASGMRLAMAAFPQGFARRIVLVSDGNENDGDLAEEIEAARANNVAVDVVPLEYRHENEILFDRVTVPAHAARDTKVPVRMIIRSRKPAQGKLTLYHNDQEVPLADPIVNLTGDMKADPFTIPIQVGSGGIHRFDARIEPLSQSADSVAENNRAMGFTFVEDEGKVLILTQPGSDDKVLYEALVREMDPAATRKAGREPLVNIFDTTQINIDLMKLREYGVVVLANIPADTFNEVQHKALQAYVRDFGGGLIMTGGDQAFGAGGWIGKPLEEVSPVTFEVRHKKVLPRGALAIVMHTCEIPKGNYWAEQVSIAALETISSLDYYGIICYSMKTGGYDWDVPLAPAMNKPGIINKVKQMQPGDMPDFSTTMDIAVRDLMALKGVSQRHIILISDGDPTPPMASTIQDMIKNQITCSTVGIGYGSHVDEAKLRTMANQTNGRFYACRNPRQLPQIFVKEAKVVKRPLIDDRPFQPQMVGLSQATLGIGASELPRLGGLVLTTPKPDCSLPISRRTSDGDDPVLAHWNCDMGKMAVFTSGWWPKWGGDWAAWEKFGKFWSQLIRWAMRQKGEADFDIVTRIEGSKGKIAIEALNKDAAYLNFLKINGRVLTPSMDQKPIYLSQTGPGQYEGSFDVGEHGNYLVSLRYTDPQHETGMINTGVSLPYSSEFRELGANVPLLQRAADRTGGRILKMDPNVDKVFDRHLPPSISRQPVWRWVLQWLLLPLFLLDVAARRLASSLAMSLYVEAAVLVLACAALATGGAQWWGYLGALVLAELVGWTIRRQYLMPTIRFFTEAVSARAAQRSEAVLSELKDVREKVREGLSAPAAGEGLSARAVGEHGKGIALEPPADRSARFDAGEAAAAEPAGDLTEALGGADQSDVAPQPGQGAPGKGEDMTSRLLKAKRRARDEMREKEN